MEHGDFVELISRRAADGRSALANLGRALICDEDADLLRRLDLSDDRIFLEPTLFSFFKSREASPPLPQLLLGYMRKESAPAEIPILSDEWGIVHLPGLGYLQTSEPQRRMLLVWRGDIATSSVMRDGRPVSFVFHETDVVPGTEIEVYRACPLGFRPFFRDPDDQPLDVDVACIARQKAELAKQACAIIEQVYGEYFEAMRAAIRGLVIYDGTYPCSFANLGAHGVAFLNARPESSIVFFLEDILHQCSHVIFTAATLDAGDILAIDPSTPLRAVTELDDYAGGVYGAFHGLFTQLNINLCLRACRERRVFSGRDAHELNGRISDDMKRFGTAIHALGRREFYTELGWDMFCHFKDAFVSLYASQRLLIERFDTSNQLYVFDFGRFLERNPLPAHSMSR